MCKPSSTMISLKFLSLIVSLMLINAEGFCTNEDNKENEKFCKVDYRLPDTVVPLHYNIKISLRMRKYGFGGETDINIKILHETRNISLHVLGLEIYESYTRLTHEKGTVYRPIQHDFQDYHLMLNFNDTLSPGLYTLSFKYKGFFSEMHGFTKIRNTKTRHDEMRWTLMMQPKKNAARLVFPCWEEPASKTTFNISVRHHKLYSVFSTMPIREQQLVNADDTMIWSHFETTPLMSTYQLGIVLSDVHHFNDKANDNVINVWCREGLKTQVMFVQRIARVIGRRLERYMNSSLKIPKVDIIAVPDYEADSSSVWGILLLRESLIVESKDSTRHKMILARSIAHEMTRQWFNNVSPKWWSDLWLSEGFASFFELHILDQIHKDWRMSDIMIHTLHRCLHLDDDALFEKLSFQVKSFYDVDTLEYLTIMDKAQILLRMLKYLVSDEVFRKGIIIYLRTHEFASATSDDFWSALEIARKEADIKDSDFTVKTVMDTWINQTGFPLVKVTRNYETGETMISQTLYRKTDTDEANKVHKTWWIPVTYTTQTNPDFSNTSIYWLTGSNTLNFELDANDWIIVNLQQMGYYRVNYDSTNWQRIAAYLNSNNYTKIHILNRAQIIDDVYHFLMEKQLDFSIFVNITTYLRQESEQIPWFSMFKILPKLWRAFLLPIKESAILKSHIVRILNGLLHNIGYEENLSDDSITKSLRESALEWACNLNDFECKRQTAIKLEENIENLDGSGVLISSWKICNGLKMANVSTWTKFMDLYLQAHKDLVLELLTCSENMEIIIDYLKILRTMSENSVITRFQYVYIFDMIINKYASNDMILDYILENIDDVKPRSSSVTTVLKDIILNIYSERQLDKVQLFLDNNSLPECLPTFINMRSIQLRDIVSNFQERLKER